MESLVSEIITLFPENINLSALGNVTVLLVGGLLFLAILFRIIKGKLSDLNHSLCSAITILAVYCIVVLVWTYVPPTFQTLLTPLPLVSFQNHMLILFSFRGADLTLVCHQLLSTVILAFMVNLMDTILPDGKRIITWYLFRLLSGILSVAAYLLVNHLSNRFLPGALLTYAPVILFCILTFLLLLGILKLILGIVLTIVNPILGAIYAFFFSNSIGKQLSKAVLTTIILTAAVLILSHFGFGVFTLSGSFSLSYIPVLALVLALWYLIGHIL